MNKKSAQKPHIGLMRAGLTVIYNNLESAAPRYELGAGGRPVRGRRGAMGGQWGAWWWLQNKKVDHCPGGAHRIRTGR